MQHEIDLQLEMRLYPDGRFVNSIAEAEVPQLIANAYDEFWRTPAGSTLEIRAEQAGISDEQLCNRIERLLAERFGSGKYPRIPFVWRLEQIGRDLLAVEIPAVVPPQQTPQKSQAETEQEKFRALVAQVEADMSDATKTAAEVLRNCEQSFEYRRAYNFIKSGGLNPRTPKEEPSEELKSFVRNWKHSVEALGVGSLRPVGGMVRVGRLSYPVSDYQRLVDEASAVGLL